ncbi:hypothetical protein ACFL0D_08010 [Thermoproteota archaeon]
MNRKSLSILFILSVIIFSMLMFTAKSQTQYYLTLETDPLHVLSIDPSAVTGEGLYDSGDTATMDAKPTIIDAAGTTKYDFVRWIGADWAEPEGNPAYKFMDGDYTATAEYDISYYITLETDPPEVLSVDPSAVTGEGWHSSGSTATMDAKQTVIAGAVQYEFVEWVGEDWAEPEGNPAYKFMDAPYTLTAVYETVEAEWEYSYGDADRGTSLWMNTDDNLFQFKAPGKWFPVKEARRLVVREYSIRL